MLCSPLEREKNLANSTSTSKNLKLQTPKQLQETLDTLRIACKNTRIMCAVMLDTKGPEIRTGFLENEEPIRLIAGDEVTITTDYEMKGRPGLIAMSYKKLAQDVAPGSQILCADGSIVLEVISTDVAAGTVQAKCLNNATLGERKNVNLPGVVVDLPTLTEKDEGDLRDWGVPNNIDFVAASFVRKGIDLDLIRSVLGPKGAGIKIISKVENQEGLQNFDAILEKSDAIMVARGDLGMEIPTEKIFLAQKMMIQKVKRVSFLSLRASEASEGVASHLPSSEAAAKRRSLLLFPSRRSFFLLSLRFLRAERQRIEEALFFLLSFSGFFILRGRKTKTHLFFFSPSTTPSIPLSFSVQHGRQARDHRDADARVDVQESAAHSRRGDRRRECCPGRHRLRDVVRRNGGGQLSDRGGEGDDEDLQGERGE